MKRRLTHIYHGRFCFKLPGVRCGPKETTWSRSIGQEEELGLAPSAYGVTIGSFNVKHTFSETISYTIGPGASTNPVWCHDDSELHIYESSSYVSKHLFRRRSRLFLPADPGFFASNYLDPDPECRLNGNGDSPPPGPEPGPTKVPGNSPGQMTQLVEAASFSNAEGGEGEDPETSAAAAAQVLGEDLVAGVEPEDPGREDWYRPGLIGLNRSICWFDGREDSRPAVLVPASAGCLARDRGLLLLTPEERSRPFPVLGFAYGTGAERAEISVIAKGAGGSGEVWSDEAVVREDGFELEGVIGAIALTTFWGYADLSSLPDGVSGSILGRAFDSSGDLVAMLDLPFSTEEQPEPVPATIREVAGTI